jgi:hypothetical protein
LSSNEILSRCARVGFYPLAVLGVSLFAPALFASPCEVAPLTTYEASGFTCTIDGYTLSDLTFTSSSTGGAPLATDSEITVNPFLDSSGYVIQFESDDFTNDTSGTAQYIAQYELDPVLPRINGIDIDLGPADPPVLIGQFCGNGTFTGPFDPTNIATSCMGTDTEGIFPLTLGPLNTNNSDVGMDFPIPVTSVDNRLIMQLEGPSSAAFFEEGVSLVATPEPSLLALLIPALFGLVLLRRKRLASVR